MIQRSGIPGGAINRPPAAAPVLALDISSETIRAGLVSPVRLGAVSSIREVVATAETPTPSTDGEAILAAAVRIAGELLRERPSVAACGAAVDGVVDIRTGVVVAARPSLPDLDGMPMAALLADQLGVPVAMDSSVNAFVVGEAVAGAAAGAGSAVTTFVGTSIGGGLLASGLIWRGAHSAGGEIGHLPVPGAGDRPCPCGGRGHVESVATGPAMSARYADRTRVTLPFQQVADRAQAGEEAAQMVLTEGAEALGRALGGLVNILDPEVVVIGGDVADAGAVFWTPLRAAYERDLVPATAAVPLRPATLGDQAVLIGAAELVLRSATQS